MDAQDQGQGFDIQNVIQSLVQMLGPQEADAATRRPSAPVANQVPQQATPVTQLPPVPNMPQQPDYTGMNVPQAMQMRNQLVNQQIAQQKLALAQQKAQPQDVGQRLAQILGGPQSATQPPDVLFRGVTPGTGTPYFSNFNAPEGYAPEPQRQAFLQDYKARQDAIAQQQQQKSGGVDAGTLTQVSQLMTTLEKAGVPADVRSMILAKTFPQFKAEKELNPDQLGKLWKFNPQTRDFEPVPPELSGLPAAKLGELGYRSVSDKQRASVNELSDVNIAFQQLKGAVADAANVSVPELFASRASSGRIGGTEGAAFQKASTNFTTIFDKFLGGVRGGGSPAMQAIREKVLPQLYSSPELTQKLMGDMEQLINGMADTRLRTVVGGKAMETSDLKPLDPLANRILQQWSQLRAQGQLAAAPKMGAAGSSAPMAALRTPATSQRLPNGVTFRWKD